MIYVATRYSQTRGCNRENVEKLRQTRGCNGKEVENLRRRLFQGELSQSLTNVKVLTLSYSTF